MSFTLSPPPAGLVVAAPPPYPPSLAIQEPTQPVAPNDQASADAAAPALDATLKAATTSILPVTAIACTQQALCLLAHEARRVGWWCYLSSPRLYPDGKWHVVFGVAVATP